MSTYYILCVLMITIGYVSSGVIPDSDKSIDEIELWEHDNLVEPPPNLMFFPHIRSQDRFRNKVPPQSRLKQLIKAIYEYERTHDVPNKVKTVVPDTTTSLVTDVTTSAQSDIATTVSSEDISTTQLNEEPIIVVEVNSQEAEKPNKKEYELNFYAIKDVTSTENTQNSEQTVVSDDATTTESESIEQTTQKPEMLLEDLVDSIVHIPSIWASDKSHKYMHSITRGYGIPTYTRIR